MVGGEHLVGGEAVAEVEDLHALGGFAGEGFDLFVDGVAADELEVVLVGVRQQI